MSISKARSRPSSWSGWPRWRPDLPRPVERLFEFQGLAERIDHGVRAVEDAALMAELAERRIPLGVCPASNIALGLYPSGGAHPIERLRVAGVQVSVDTDDSAYLGDPLSAEYAACAETFGWSPSTLPATTRPHRVVHAGVAIGVPGPPR